MKIRFPDYQIPEGFSGPDAYLEHITRAGAKTRYGELSPGVEARIRDELNIIRANGCASYFLVVSKCLKIGNETGAFIGAGCGSAPGSIVNFCLEITNVDPLKYNLLFERFLNPEHAAMPDIDTDLDKEGRLTVIRFWEENYPEITIDFRELEALTILKTTLELAKEKQGSKINISEIPLNDSQTFQCYKQGQTDGILQFESANMQASLRELNPTTFNELAAMNAMQGSLHEFTANFIARKSGQENISYDLPVMEEILTDTYGLTIYQEQIMLLAQKIAGIGKGDSDILRKAISKKQDLRLLNNLKKKFLDGGLTNGYPMDKLEKIWAEWEAVGQFTRSKAHFVCYTIIAFQMTYLKTHYPAEYSTAVKLYSRLQ